MGGTHQILIVDDEPDVRAALRRTLSSTDFTILEAKDGIEALSILQGSSISAVIADHNMPKMTGLELLRQIQKKYPAIIRLLITARADVNLAVSALNEGAVHRMLLKPWDHTDIPGILTMAIRGTPTGETDPA